MASFLFPASRSSLETYFFLEEEENLVTSCGADKDPDPIHLHHRLRP